MDRCEKCGRPDPTYNGWPNYETWAVALWLDNEQGSYDYWRERTADAFDEFHWTDYQREWRTNGRFTSVEIAAMILADWLAEAVRNESCPDLGASLYSDLLSAALSDVNWRCIAQHYAEDHAESLAK